jgi:ketosteroid isomerase-like protein
MFASMPANATVECADTTYMVAGDVVILSGKWSMKTPQENGEPAVLNGRVTDIIAKRGGRWVYILDHASVPFVPPSETGDGAQTVK